MSMGLGLAKSDRGCRAFIGEVGVIVLGVLIALGAQQTAEAINNRQVASETRAALTEEIEENLAYVALRGRAMPCVDKRLAELRAIVDRWGRTGGFETPLWVAQAPSIDINTTRFDAAQSAGRLALLPREEQFRFGEIVAGLRNFQDGQDQELQVWSKLRALQSGASALSMTDRTAIRMALQDASTLNYHHKLSMRQLLPEAAKYGFTPDMKRHEESAKRIWTNGRYSPSICVGIDTPPDRANREANQAVSLPQ